MREIILDSASLREILEEIFSSGGSFSFRGHGSSMYPFIRDGDTLTIAPLEGRPPRLGEVVAYSCPIEKESKLVVHRVVGRRITGFIVQGDGKCCVPGVISSENILGRLFKVERNGRHARLGLGPERRLIALLTRTKLLWSLFWPVWRRLRQLFKPFN